MIRSYLPAINLCDLENFISSVNNFSHDIIINSFLETSSYGFRRLEGVKCEMIKSNDCKFSSI
jgi:hypothetical protein